MSIEAMKQALEALELMVTPRGFQAQVFCKEAYDNLRQAIAEAEKQKPHGYLKLSNAKFYQEIEGVPDIERNPDYLPLYTHPKAEQELVAMQMDVIVANLVREGINKHRARELAEHFIKHAHPQPKCEWVGLTDEERKECATGLLVDGIEFARNIEAKLKQKNGYAEGKNT